MVSLINTGQSEDGRSLKLGSLYMILGVLHSVPGELTQPKTLAQNPPAGHVLLLLQFAEPQRAGKHQDVRHVHQSLQEGYGLFYSQTLVGFHHFYLPLQNNIYDTIRLLGKLRAGYPSHVSILKLGNLTAWNKQKPYFNGK